MEVEEVEQKFYGWYSKDQERVSGRRYKYSTPCGREVIVTEVSIYPEKSCSGFPDRVFVSEVTTLICRYQRCPEQYLPKKEQKLLGELDNLKL